jgi:hypothetical protein
VGIHVERSIEVEVPVRVAYDRWLRWTIGPRSTSGTQNVQQVGEPLTHWGAEIDGLRREWDALVARAGGREITWAATTGPTRTATVCLTAVGRDHTRIWLTLDDRSEGLADSVDAAGPATPDAATASHSVGMAGAGISGGDPADPAAPILNGYPGERVGHTEVGGQEPGDAAAGVVTGYPGARAPGAHHLDDPAAGVLTGYPGGRAGHTATGGQGAGDPAAGVLTGYPGARTAGHLGTESLGRDE